MVSTSGFNTSSAARTAEAPAPCRISWLFSDLRTKKTSPQVAPHPPGRFSVEAGHPIRVRGAVEGEDRHPEVGGLARHQLTQPEELLPGQPELLGQRVKVFPDEFRDEQLGPSRRGGAGGER